LAAYSCALCPSTPAAPPLRVRRYASYDHSMSMERAKCHVGRFSRQLRYPFEFRGDVPGGLWLHSLSLQRFRDPVPFFARRGPSGRFPRFLARIRHSDSLIPVARPLHCFASAYLSCSAGGIGASQGSWGTLAYMPCSATPGQPPRRTYGLCCPSGTSVLSSATTKRRPARFTNISGFNRRACMPAVYASSPPLPTDTQDSLPAGGQP
jgi:hypothetical protein